MITLDTGVQHPEPTRWTIAHTAQSPTKSPGTDGTAATIHGTKF